MQEAVSEWDLSCCLHFRGWCFHRIQWFTVVCMFEVSVVTEGTLERSVCLCACVCLIGTEMICRCRTGFGIGQWLFYSRSGRPPRVRRPMRFSFHSTLAALLAGESPQLALYCSFTCVRLIKFLFALFFLDFLIFLHHVQ